MGGMETCSQHVRNVITERIICIYIYSENQQKPLPVQDHMFQTLVLPQQRAKARGEPVAGGIFALSAIWKRVLRSCGQEGLFGLLDQGYNYIISIY
jgi:hypothetical protein